jgi:hypothetical protein
VQHYEVASSLGLQFATPTLIFFADMSEPKSRATRPIALVRLIAGVHLDGSFARIVKSAGKGRHCGWTIAEDAAGIVASKDGEHVRIPWTGVSLVEYATDG